MFALLNPRIWMLVGLAAAVIAAFFAGVKVESNRRDAQLLGQQQRHEKEVQDTRKKEQEVAERIAQQLDAERKKNQDLSVQIQTAMRPAANVHAIKCPARSPAQPKPTSLHVDAAGAASTSAPSSPGSTSSDGRAAATSSGVTPITAADTNMEEGDETDVSMDDPIFQSDFIGLYNAAIARDPKGLPAASSGAHGGDSPAASVSGRDIIGNLDENGKRFADCREKLTAWQTWAHTFWPAK